MKNQFKRHMLSFALLTSFLLFASSSVLWELLDFAYVGLVTTTDSDQQRIRIETYEWLGLQEGGSTPERQVIQTGGQDKYGRWDRTIRIEHRLKNAQTNQWETYCIEETPIKGSTRHGKGKIIYPKNSEESFVCYDMGVRIACSGLTTPTNRELSAFDQLEMDQPWFLNYWLSTQGNLTALENFVTGIEAQLNTYSFEPTEFDEYYNLALDDLENDGQFLDESDYYHTMAYFSGITFMKNFEFRRALIDRYDGQNNGTFEIIQSIYPDWAEMLYSIGITESDFLLFCQDFDQRMDETGILDPNDLYFLDSVDNRMYRIIDEYLNEEFGLGGIPSQFIHSFPWKKGTDLQAVLKSRVMQGQLRSGTGNKEIAEWIAYLLLLQYAEGDLIKSAVRKSWFKTKEVPVLATLVTESLENTSATSVKVRGHIIDDGGAGITQRGFVWGDQFNPTLQSNVITLGNGTGEFQTIIHNLTEGKHYFVRTYAVNSVGVAYGNVAEFTPEAMTNTFNETSNPLQMQLFPNPASHAVTLFVHTPQMGNIDLTVYDLNGIVVLQRSFSGWTASGQQIPLDISLLRTGIYLFHLSDGKQTSIQRLVIE